MKTKISDKEFAEIERLGNCAIHEIVFALQHAENDEPEDAAQCLMTAGLNLDQIAEKMVEHGG